jgi:hypothetical protein
MTRLLKNAHLPRFPAPAPFNVRKSTPRGSGDREHASGHFEQLENKSNCLPVA